MAVDVAWRCSCITRSRFRGDPVGEKFDAGFGLVDERARDGTVRLSPLRVKRETAPYRWRRDF